MSPSNAAPRPRWNGRKISIGLISFSLFTGTAARYVLSPMQELVQVDLGLDDGRIALLQGMAIALPTALISIPIGRVVDRANRSRLLLMLALLCVAGSMFTAVAHDFGLVFMARLLVGGAVLAAQPAALSLIADLTDASHRGRVITLATLAQALGGTAAYLLAGDLLSWLPAALQGAWLGPWWSALPGAGALSRMLSLMAPWRLVQLVFAALMMLAVLALLLLREPERLEARSARAGSLLAALRELLAYRKFLLPLLGGIVTVGMADAAASIWAVPVLSRSFHQSPADFAGWMGLLTLGANILGALLGGLLADFGQKKLGGSGLLLGAVAGTVLSVPAALFPLMPGVGGFAVLLGLLLSCGACVNIVATAAIMVVLPNELRGLCFSLLLAIVGLAAFGIAPLLVSTAAPLFGPAGAVSVPLACVGVLTSALGAVSFWWAMRANAR